MYWGPNVVRTKIIDDQKYWGPNVFGTNVLGTDCIGDQIY